MSDTPSTPKHLVRAADLGPGDALHIRHPFNDKSDIYMTRLSDRTGMTHLGVSMARVPPGKESFVLHAHTRQEEWVYVLSGRGHVCLGEAEYPIEPGDFVGFPPDGTPHLIRNSADVDLIYLQGGDRREGDMGHFPTIGKVGYQLDEGHMALIDKEQIQAVPFSAWMADTPKAGPDPSQG